MEIIDAHHHLWDTNDLDYELFRDRPELQGSFRLARYEEEARACGVTGSVLVEAASAGADPILETEWLLREIEGSDFVKGLVAWAPLDDPKRLEAHLDWLQVTAGKKLVGVRRSFEWDPDDFPRRREVIEGCRIVGERRLTVDLVMFSRSLPATVDLVAELPGTRFILDHLGKPVIGEAGADQWRVHFSNLALLPNVYCKLSGLTGEAAAVAPTTVRTYIDEAIRQFGSNRAFFGSDWPISELYGSYRDWLDCVRRGAAAASDRDAVALIFSGAGFIYGFEQQALS